MSDFREQLIPRRKREKLVGMWFLDLEPAQRSLIGRCRHSLNRSGAPFGGKPLDFSVGVRPRAARIEKHLRGGESEGIVRFAGARINHEID
jgi:hypothetical protein